MLKPVTFPASLTDRTAVRGGESVSLCYGELGKYEEDRMFTCFGAKVQHTRRSLFCSLRQRSTIIQSHMSKNKGGWTVLDEHIYEKFPIFQIKRSRRVNPRTKKEIGFFLIDGLDWVTVIPVTPDNKVVLVKQYRHGCEDFTIETPGGCVEIGEDPAESAKRELLEETGYQAPSLELLGTFCPNAAMLSNRCHAYLAHGVTRVAEQALDSGEDIEVLLIPLPEVMELVRTGGICHAVVLAGFGYLALRHLHESR